MIRLAPLRPIRRRLADDADAQRTERLLAAARLTLAVASLVAIYIDPTEPSRFSELCYSLLAAYVLLAAIVLWLIAVRPAAGRRLVPWLHLADIVWPTLLTFFTTGPSSPFFALFTFVVVSAAFRWGLRATLATASLVVLLLAGQAVVIADVPSMGPPIELNQLLIRSSYLMLVATLVGVLADREERQRAESVAVARVLEAARAERGVVAILGAVCREIAAAFDLPRSIVVLRDRATGRCYFQRSGRTPGELTELDREQASACFFDAPEQSDAWFVARRAAPGALASVGRWLVVNPRGRCLPAFDWRIPEDSGVLDPWRSQLCATLHGGDEWEGRLFLLDADPRPADGEAVRLLQALCGRAAPDVYRTYLIRRLRARVRAFERSRLARELHERVVQGLVALQFQLEALRRRTETAEPWIAETVDRLQADLHREVVGIRDLMKHLHGPDAERPRSRQAAAPPAV